MGGFLIVNTKPTQTIIKNYYNYGNVQIKLSLPNQRIVPAEHS